MNMSIMRGSVITALAAVLVALPATAEAQGRGNGKDREANRPELIRRGEDVRVESRGDDRRGPAFCRNGQGHPVHGQRWCYDKGFGLGSGVLLGQVDERGDRRRSGSRDAYGSAGSYERAHQEFHLRHDRQCRMRAAERPLDIQWQIRVRSECKQRHDDWHHRAGRQHG